MLTYALSGTPTRDAPVKVAAVSSGTICEYNWTDLQYADGSKPVALRVGREPLFGEMRRGNKEGGDDHTKNIEKARS